MKINGETIGKELKALRVKNNLTQKDMALKLDVHENTIRRYEINADGLNLDLFLKWLSECKIDEVIFFNIIREYNH